MYLHPRRCWIYCGQPYGGPATCLPGDKAPLPIYRQICNSSGGTDHALRAAQRLIIAAPEFHATNVGAATTNNDGARPRKTRKPQPYAARPYKALVVLELFGGAARPAYPDPFLSRLGLCGAHS